jgi:hypothetical protein
MQAISAKFGPHAGKIEVIIQKEGEQQTALIMYIIIPAYFIYRGAGKSLARPTSRCILFDRIFRLMLVLFYI